MKNIDLLNEWYLNRTKNTVKHMTNFIENRCYFRARINRQFWKASEDFSEPS
ncbi:unnamed protein product [Acanthoscelides obtectus]|uniref:Uncharacterized protein n=1 Tax=Acanthoscelides obtectus TaxID=200917 RepID=A0A9P0PDW5_ACAOB|nr:unnamed protein product [Acanthoscelides obtectus]CAK1676903.1 hypothetical protein AOBTE_LOCUS30993 [Acanthoscelides obtectus]